MVMAEIIDLLIKMFEIRLVSSSSPQLIFTTARPSAADAENYARRLLDRHTEFECAEIWCGMQHLRTA